MLREGKNFFLVLGKKLRSDGSVSREFDRQLWKAGTYLLDDKNAILVISGGQTRKGYPSEAWVGSHSKGLAGISGLRIVLEKESKTTSENIRFVLEMLRHERIGTLTVITGAAHLPRTKLLFKRLWPEICDRLYADSVPSSLFDWVVNSIQYILTRLDPGEKLFVPIAKKLLRNGS